MSISDSGIKLNNGKIIDFTDSNLQIEQEDLPSQFAAIFDLVDLNSDGTLQAREVQALWTKIVKNAGKNQNSVFETKEAEKFLEQHKSTLKVTDFMAFLENINSKIQTDKSQKLAQQFYNIADDNSSSASMKKMLNFLDNEINADNILGFLEAYDDESIRKSDSSIIDTITSEVGAGILWSSDHAQLQKNVLLKIMAKLSEAARKAGVSEADIESANEAFTKSLDEEINSKFRRTNPKDMEKAIDFLKRAILVKMNPVSNTDEVQAREVVARNFAGVASDANQSFKAAKDGENGYGGWGWAAKAGDWMCGLFGCSTIEDLEAKLGENAKYAKLLIDAAETGEVKDPDTGKILKFNDIYKKLFGIDFDANKVFTAQKAQEDFNKICKEGGAELALTVSTFEELISSAENGISEKDFYKMLKEKLGWTDDVINEVLKSNSDNSLIKSNIIKIEGYLKDARAKMKAQLNELTGGRDFLELQKETAELAKAAYGVNDIAKDVAQFNENMIMTDLAVSAAAEIAGTIALQFVPGLGQIAAAKLASSAANWGVKGIKIVKYAQKAEKAFSAVGKAQKTVNGASRVQKAKTLATTMAVSAANTGVATAVVNLSNKKDVKEVLKKTFMNMSFSAVGTTSATLAPHLMKIFNISSKLATELAEEIINAAGSYAVTKANGADYTTSDAFLDLITGLVISRISSTVAANMRAADVDVNSNLAKSTDASIPDMKNIDAISKEGHQAFATKDIIKKLKTSEHQKTMGQYFDYLSKDLPDAPSTKGKYVKPNQYYLLPDGSIICRIATDSKNIELNQYGWPTGRHKMSDTEFVFEIIDPSGNSHTLVASGSENCAKAQKLFDYMESQTPLNGDFKAIQRQYLENKNQVGNIDKQPQFSEYESAMKNANFDDIGVQKQMLQVLEDKYPSTKGVPGRIATLKELQKLMNSPEYLQMNEMQRQIAELTILKSNPRIDGKNLLKDSNVSKKIKSQISAIEKCLANGGNPKVAAALYKDGDIETLIAIAKARGIDDNIIKQFVDFYNKGQANGCMLINNTSVDTQKVPTKKVEKNGKSYNIKIVDCSDPKVFENPEKYGLPPGTTSDNMRLTVHMNDDFNRYPSKTIGRIQQAEDLNLSATVTNGKNALYDNQQVGIGLAYDMGSVGYASNYAAGTGFVQDITKLAEYKLSFDTPSQATFVRDKFIERMKKYGIDISIEDYAVFSKQFQDKQLNINDLSKIATNGKIDINGKQVPLNIVQQNLIASTDDLINTTYEVRGQTIKTGMNEIKVENPEIAYIYVRANSPDDTLESILSPEMLEYIEKNNLTVVFQKHEIKTNSVGATTTPVTTASNLENFTLESFEYASTQEYITNFVTKQKEIHQKRMAVFATNTELPVQRTVSESQMNTMLDVQNEMGEYFNVKEKLRSGQPLNKKEQEFFNSVMNAMEPTNTERTVWRSIANYEGLEEQIRAGKIKENFFSSTASRYSNFFKLISSTNLVQNEKGITATEGCMLKINIPEKTPVLDCNAVYEPMIGEKQYTRMRDEVVLPPGTYVIKNFDPELKILEVDFIADV